MEDNKQNIPEMPEEVKKKFDVLKTKLNKFKKKALTTYNKEVIGMALLPPEKEKSQSINVLVLLEDIDAKKTNIETIFNKIDGDIKTIAKDIDANIKPDTILISELREMLFDGKYELLKSIALSAILYDPRDLLGALKISEVHKNMTIKKFEKYVVSYVISGSIFREAKAHDIDVYIVVDDTDVKKMPRAELKDKLGSIIRSYGWQASDITGVKKGFHVQVYILTDFWESLKDANPVIFTLLRDGIPLYDRGVFMPWKLLLKMGRIRPSREAIDIQMDIGERLLERIKHKLLSVIGEDIYYATLNPSQAALMLYGVTPPTPKETVQLLEEIFVKKEKLLEKKYVDILEKTTRYYKDIEHGKVKEVKGVDIDKLLKDANLFLKRIQKLFTEIEKRREAEDIMDVYDMCISVTKEALESLDVNTKNKNVISLFKKTFVNERKFPERYLKILKQVEKAKKDYSKKKLTKQEAGKVKREASMFVRSMAEFIQRSHSFDIERNKIKFKYGDTLGELLVVDNIVFINKDVKKKSIIKADYKNSVFSNVKNSSMKEYDESLKKAKPEHIPVINNKLIKSLSNIIGKEVEIII